MKILVVSDNLELINHLRSFIENKLGQEEFTIEIYCSKENAATAQFCEIGVNAISLNDRETLESIKKRYSIAVSLHCKQIFPAELVNAIECVNFHPGYNPHNRGWYPQVFSILNKLPVGVTVHRMDEHIDHGPIIYREQITIDDADTSFEVYRRLIELQKKLIEDHFSDIIRLKYNVMKPEEEGNYNAVSDFKKLCDLDLSNVGTLGEHIDLLRALSHNGFRNAFYRDKDGRKIFISVTLDRE